MCSGRRPPNPRPRRAGFAGLCNASSRGGLSSHSQAYAVLVKAAGGPDAIAAFCAGHPLPHATKTRPTGHPATRPTRHPTGEPTSQPTGHPTRTHTAKSSSSSRGHGHGSGKHGGN